MSSLAIVEGARVDVINAGDDVLYVNFKVNDKSLFANDGDVIAEIKASALFEERGFAFAAWDWLMDNQFHFNPYSAQVWQHAPYLFLNSIGFGLCDDVASVYYSLVTSYGYEARVWSLDGHVVCEVFNGGRWELYDPDLGALYIDEYGDIAGYEYVANNLENNYRINLQNSEFADVINPPDWPYDDWVLDFYRTQGNNEVSLFAMAKQDEFSADSARIALPVGSYARLLELYDYELLSIYGDSLVGATVMEVHFDSVDAFEFRYPLVPLSISGSGAVLIDGVTYEIGSASLIGRLALRDSPVYSISVSSSGSDNVITYLMNPVRFSLDGAIDIQLLDVEGAPDFILVGGDVGDAISGTGGGDTLLGGGGDDRLSQIAEVVNGAAGSVLDGGAGNDELTFDGSQAYTSSYVTLAGGEGDDRIAAGTAPWQYVGSVRIEGGTGDDVIEVGHVEGSRSGLGYIDGGDGRDLIRVTDTWGGIGIWGNSTFRLLGGAGDDRFELAGRQVNVLGGDQGAQLGGEAGFDTLAWNGQYNLTIGGAQNPALGLYAGYAQELKVGNIEHIDVAATGVSGLTLRFAEQDVAAITAGSDFDRGALGLNLSGVGGTLFVNAGGNVVDLAGWSGVGAVVVGGLEYGLYQQGAAYLGVLSDLTLVGTPDADRLQGYGGNDVISGAGGGDTLIGGGGDDTLNGGPGNDILIGGGGGDQLFGGEGNDVFVFLDVGDSSTIDGLDVIMDFESGSDAIDLSQVDADGNTPECQAFTYIGASIFTGTAGELRLDELSGGIAGDTNGDGIAEFRFSVAGGVSVSDLLL